MMLLGMVTADGKGKILKGEEMVNTYWGRDLAYLVYSFFFLKETKRSG